MIKTLTDEVKKECTGIALFDFAFPQKKRRTRDVIDVVDAGALYDNKFGVIKEEQGRYFAREGNKRGWTEIFDGDTVNIGFPNSKNRRGRVGNGIAKTLTTQRQEIIRMGNEFRYLTSRDHFRLMGFSDDDWQTLHDARFGDVALYRFAGNSIVVDVLRPIFKELLGGDVNHRKNTTCCNGNTDGTDNQRTSQRTGA